MAAKISVILTAYNMAHFLPAAIDSAIHNTFQDLELIIIDDGSTDNTREVVDRYRQKACVNEFFIAFDLFFERVFMVCFFKGYSAKIAGFSYI